MAVLKPFNALRPIKEKADKVASVPYDVVDREEALKLAKGNPISFLHVIRPEIDLPEDVDPYSDEVYNKARENFLKLIDEKILIEDGESSVFLYRLQTEDHSQVGIAGCYSVDEYDRGLIKKHEQTRKEKEDDRVKHMLTLRAHTGPVLLAFRTNQKIKDLVKKELEKEPLYDFTADDGVRHTIWKVADKDGLVGAFRELPALYIADGHHRAAGASRVQKEMQKKLGKSTGDEEFNYFLAVSFPDDELKIYAYNRYINYMGNLTAGELLKELGKSLKIVENGSSEPAKKGIISMYLNKKWYELHIPEDLYDKTDPVKSLDLSVFQQVVLEPLFNIVDQKRDKRIDFVGGPGSAEKLKAIVDKNGGIAFTFYPVSIDELMKVADAGMNMPPKSTWFAPKLRSGLLIHRF